MATRKTPASAPTPVTSFHLGCLLGLGIMGSAMAGNLLKAGFAVSGHDPSAATKKRFRAAGGKLCADAGVLASHVDVVTTSLASAAALLQSAQRIVRGFARARLAGG